MATYVLIALGDSALAVDNAVQMNIPSQERYAIEPGKWLINSPLATSKEIADKLEPLATSTFLSCAVRGYWGRARSDIWEWLSTKAQQGMS